MNQATFVRNDETTLSNLRKELLGLAQEHYAVKQQEETLKAKKKTLQSLMSDLCRKMLDAGMNEDEALSAYDDPLQSQGRSFHIFLNSCQFSRFHAQMNFCVSTYEQWILRTTTPKK